MNKAGVFILTTLLCCIVPAACASRSKVRADFEQFKIEVMQDGMVKDSGSGEVLLYKKPFDLVIFFPQPDSIFVNASFDPQSYTAAREGKDVNAIPGFTQTGAEEELFNANEVFFISKTTPNYWHYGDTEDHSFNEVEQTNGIFKCTRTISRIVHYDSPKKELVSLFDIDNEEIYLVFMKLDWNNDYSRKIEMKRVCLKIVFK